MSKFTPMMTVVAVSMLINSLSIAQIKPGPMPNPPGPTNPPAPGPVTPTPPPAKKELDTRRMEEIARAGAEIYASDVLEIVGGAFQVRYNIREGILDGKNRVGDYDNRANVTRSRRYQDSYEVGARNGSARGTEVGANEAARRAYGLADSDISAAIDVAIDNHSAVDFTPHPRMIPFEGLNSNLATPQDIISRLVSGRDSTNSQIRMLVRSDLPRDLFEEIFDVRRIYREHNTELPSDFKFDAAFENWRRNVLNNISGRNEDVKRFYREITDGNVYARPNENERAFRQSFLYNFGRIVEHSWRNTVTANNNRALNLGENIYVAAADGLANELGNFDGYNSQFKASTKVAFDANFIQAYNQSYASIEQEVKTSSHITGIQATIVPTLNSAEVALGDTLDVVVQSIVNRGMVAGSAKVEMAQGKQVLSANQSQVITIQGLTKDMEAKRFAAMAKISAIAGVDENIQASVVVNGQVFSVTLKSSYEEKIRRLMQTQDAAVAQEILKKTLGYMKAQYDDLSGFGDQYKNRRGDMLLVRVRKLYDTLSEDQRVKLRTYKQQFRNVFGPKPIRFLNPKRNEWDSAQAMLHEMGM